MDDPLSGIDKAGWPTLLLAGLLSLFGLFRGVADVIGYMRGMVNPPAKTDRENLSDDQDKFLERVMHRLETVESKLDHCEKSHAELAESNRLMADKLNQLIEVAKYHGVEFAMDLGSIAPIPALEPAEDGGPK